MALFLSDRLTSASGSVGGTTYSHNRQGLYIKARRVPVNPNTPAQQAQRAAFASASSGWRALSAANRDTWRAYAAATPTKNALGQTTFLTGAQQWTASQSMLTRLAQPNTTTAPATPGRVDLGTGAAVIHSAATGSVVITVTGTGVGALGVFLGDPISAGVQFFNGPYQLLGQDDSTGGGLTITPATARNGVPFVNGQRIPWRLAGVDPADGKLSTVASGISTVIT